MPWTEESPLPHPRMGLAAATCDAPAPGSGSRIYAIGGLASHNAVATVEAYDTAQKTWSATPAMPTPRSWLAAASSPGRLHALGGWGDTATPFAAHEVYEPANNAWSSQAAPLPTARGALAAVTGPDGLIYAIGGGNKQAAALDSVERYDPQADSWTPSPHPLPAATKYPAGVVGPTGMIYAIGGADAKANYTADVYSYDPPALDGRNGPHCLAGAPAWPPTRAPTGWSTRSAGRLPPLVLVPYSQT
jgi:N-acetylneuraminic acid mutarotase